MIVEEKLADDSVIKIWRFKEIVPWLHEEIGEILWIGSYAPWLNDGIYVVTNISVEILMYIQILILIKAALLLEGCQHSSLINKRNKQTKQDRYLYETNKKSGNYGK